MNELLYAVLAIDPATDVAVTTDGNGAVKIPPGGTLQTDPAALRLPDDAELAVSMFITASGGPATYHHPALETSYVVAGNYAADARLRNADPVTSLFWITGVDARVAEPGSAIAVFGDSLTNGDGTTAGTGRRFPDQLDQRVPESSLTITEKTSSEPVREFWHGTRYLDPRKYRLSPQHVRAPARAGRSFIAWRESERTGQIIP